MKSDSIQFSQKRHPFSHFTIKSSKKIKSAFLNLKNRFVILFILTTCKFCHFQF